MASFKVFRGRSEKLPTTRTDGYVYLTTDDGKIYIDADVDGYLERFEINPNADWNAEYGNANIINKPENIGKVIKGTTEWWDSQRSLVGEAGAIYIYTDYQQIEENGNIVNIPGIKIGDGSAYLIDTPFIDQLFMEHINSHDIHITPEERVFWNNKVRAVVSDELIQFTTL